MGFKVSLLALGFFVRAFAQQQPVATFGTTVVDSGGLIGVIYYIPPSSIFLPYFEFLNPVGVIYASSLNVPERDFREGFPGVTNRYEWFAIDYRGRFWIQKPGVYQFALTSADGSRLYIDDQLIVNNDGIHASQAKTASLGLDGGIHSIRVSYFQGPPCPLALVLSVRPPGGGWRVFSTDEFKPPPNPETWEYPNTRGALAPAVSATELRVSSVKGVAGDPLEFEVSVKSPPQMKMVAIEWETIFPAQVMELVGEPETGHAAADSGKALKCSKRETYLYDCLVEGGEKPISDGVIAVFRFKIHSDVESRETVLRIEKAKAIGSDQRRSALGRAEGTARIR